MSAKECLEIEPALVCRKLLGGFFNETDFTGDIHKFCVNLFHVLKTKYKVKHIQQEVTTLQEMPKGPVVVCAGVHKRISKKHSDLPTCKRLITLQVC